MSIQKLFYNSSLPRAGSTLIQNILGQNPLIHTTPTSGLYEMLSACRTIYTDGLEFKAQDATEMETGFKSFLKSGLYGFYEPLTDRPYVVEKCRGWGSEYEFINAFDPNPKIICMVRDIRAIYSSLEKKYRSNPLIDHHIANWGDLSGTTTDKRISIWSANPPIGPAMDRLYQILVQGLHTNILFVKFEELCLDPDIQMKRIYEYLELPYYKHDFENIPQYTKEDDKWYGVFGDHMIRGKLKPVKDDFKEVLGHNACSLIEENYKWFFNDFGYQI
jgi:sulfotransferase